MLREKGETFITCRGLKRNEAFRVCVFSAESATGDLLHSAELGGSICSKVKWLGC